MTCCTVTPNISNQIKQIEFERNNVFLKSIAIFGASIKPLTSPYFYVCLNDFIKI